MKTLSYGLFWAKRCWVTHCPPPTIEAREWARPSLMIHRLTGGAGWAAYLPHRRKRSGNFQQAHVQGLVSCVCCWWHMSAHYLSPQTPQTPAHTPRLTLCSYPEPSPLISWPEKIACLRGIVVEWLLTKVQLCSKKLVICLTFMS